MDDFTMCLDLEQNLLVSVGIGVELQAYIRRQT